MKWEMKFKSCLYYCCHYLGFFAMSIVIVVAASSRCSTSLGLDLLGRSVLALQGDKMVTTVVKPGLAQLGFLLPHKKSSRNYANFKAKCPASQIFTELCCEGAATLHLVSELWTLHITD